VSASAPVLATGLDRSAALDAVGRLASDPRKLDLYRDDVFFIEASAELAEAGEGLSPEALIERLERHTFILLKPDVEASGCEGRALAFLRSHGLEPIARHRFRFDRLLVRALWQHNFLGDDVIRMKIIDELLTTAPTTACLLRAEARLAPASAEISRLKGAADPARRSASLLRSHIDCPNVFLSGVHAPDDSADMIRELGLLLDRETRRAWLSLVVDDAATGIGSAGPTEPFIAPRPHDAERSRALVERVLPGPVMADLLAGSRDGAAPAVTLAAIDRLLDATRDDAELHWAAVVTLTALFAGPLPIGSGIPAASAVPAAG
jgi:hypothetical protein